MTTEYVVYVRTDGDGVIIDVNSSAFVQDAADWTEIDRGEGVNYQHAQGNYFPLPIMDDRGVYRYRLKDGQIIRRTQAEMDEAYACGGKPTDFERLAMLEEENRYLKETLEIILSGATQEEEDGQSMEETGV